MTSSICIDNKRPFTICVEGNVGSGKTSFLNHFHQCKDTLVLQEPVELWRDVAGTNLLEMMYTDPRRYTYLFQSYAQLTMTQLHAIKTCLPYKIMERSVYSTRCFIENMKRSKMLQDVEAMILEEWIKWYINNIDTKTDLIVYLRTSPEIVYQRMRTRARKEEECVSLDYLKQIHQVHDEWLYNRTLFSLPAPVIVLDGNKDIQEMLTEVKKCKDHIFECRQEMVEGENRRFAKAPSSCTTGKINIGNSI